MRISNSLEKIRGRDPLGFLPSILLQNIKKNEVEALKNFEKRHSDKNFEMPFSLVRLACYAEKTLKIGTIWPLKKFVKFLV